MNKKQRWVLFVCAAVIVLMLLFPPFHFSCGPDTPVQNNMGYAFLFHAPMSTGGYQPTVNAGTLLVQWVGVILIGGILWFAFRDKE